MFPSDTQGLAPASVGFLAEMSRLMGLPAGRPDLLTGPAPFWGPGGLMCRLQVTAEACDVPAVMPEVMLPLVAREMQGGAAMERLLSIQASLMSETDWCLGVSREGMLQLSLTCWIDEPGQAVDVLTMGNVVALQAVNYLTAREPAQDEFDEPSANETLSREIPQ